MKGSLIVYNDWDAGGSSGGEQMAHREIVSRYQMRTTDLGRSTTGRLFRVDHAPRVAARPREAGWLGISVSPRGPS